MTYASWNPRHRVTTISPGKLDLFVLTFVDGKQAAIDPITGYDAALAKARAFHRDHPCQIKVLPVTGPEVCNLLGIEMPDRPEPMDAELREQFVATLTQIVRDSPDAEARRDAMDLLTELGSLPS